MAFTNNVMIVRHGLLAKLVKLWKEDKLVEEIDELPIKLSPRQSKARGRCCIHKPKYSRSIHPFRIYSRHTHKRIVSSINQSISIKQKQSFHNSFILISNISQRYKKNTK